jgi:hypothetical protein
MKLPLITGQGVSCPEIRRLVVAHILGMKPRPQVILDLGCGIGMYGAMIRQAAPEIHMIGVDGFLPYLWQQWTQKVYAARIHAPLEAVMGRVLEVRADLTLCMDVIEHFEKAFGVLLLDSLKAPAIVSTPLFEYRQGSVGGNDLEVHRCVFSEEELNGLGWRTLFKEFHRAMDGQEGMMGAFEKEVRP